MSSSSSSSSSSQVKKKKEKKSKKKDKKKDKKSDKKDKKAEKKADKKAKKEAKRLERTADWDFDRSEVNRLVAQLLQLDDDIADELRAVFQQIDDGDVVRIDGLENKSARKKLRHLFQSFGLIAAEEQGFRTPTKKVAFVQLFEESLKKAKGSGKATSISDAPSQADAGAKKKRAALEARYQPMEVDDEAAAPAAEAEKPSEFLSFGETEAPAPAAAPQKKVVGPKLPGADLGPAGGGESSEDEGPEEAAMGPRVEGQEREGVDLDRVPKRSERQAWMSMMHESMAGAFGEGGGPGSKDKYEVKRSEEERKKFEEMYAKRGKSLLEEQRENKFAGHEEEHANVRKRKVGPSDIWGMSAKDIESGGVAAAAPKEQRRSFDPEKDLEVAKPVSREQFNSLVENSASGLSGRFSRSQIATSFL